MYTFDGYSTPITIIVFGAYFPSNPHFDFYSVCISTHVHNLYTVRKLALRLPFTYWYATELLYLVVLYSRVLVLNP